MGWKISEFVVKALQGRRAEDGRGKKERVFIESALMPIHPFPFPKLFPSVLRPRSSVFRPDIAVVISVRTKLRARFARSQFCLS